MRWSTKSTSTCARMALLANARPYKYTATVKTRRAARMRTTELTRLCYRNAHFVAVAPDPKTVTFSMNLENRLRVARLAMHMSAAAVSLDGRG